MSNLTLALNALIGGGSGALDAIDGAGLDDGDAAVVVLDTGVYHYHLDSTSGATENSPYVISPDDNPGTKRWILVTPQAPFSHVDANLSSDQTMTDNTLETVVFNTENHDALGEYVHTTGIFTPLYSGTYHLNAICTSANVAFASGDLMTGYWYVNAASILPGVPCVAWASLTGRLSTISCGTVQLTASDTVLFKASIKRGSDTDISSNIWTTHMSIDRIA